MGIKDQTATLILKAKNLLSPGTDEAADSVDNLGDSAEALKDKLRSLEDQGKLVKQFQQSEKAVDRAGKSYERLQKRAEKMAAKLEKSSNVTEAQTREWYELQDAIGKSEAELKKAQGTMDALGREVQDAGVDLGDLNKAQRENQKETVKARRALQDFNEEVDRGDSGLTKFRKGLSQGVTTFLKWGVAATAATAAASVAVLTRFTAQQADLARQTLATADALGISTASLQEWQYAAKSVGIEGDKTADIMKDVSEKIGDAFLTGGGEAADVIKGLNLDIEKLVRLSPDKQLLAISEQLNGLPKSGQILILESLASDASLLLPLLDNNAAKLRELSAAASERGTLISEDDLKKLAETNEAFKRIGDRLTEFQNRLAADLAPTFKQIASDFDDFLAGSPGLVEDIAGAFAGLITTTKNWVNSILDKREEIASTFQTIASTAKFLGSSFEALFRGTQAFAAGTLEVLTRVGYSASDLYLTIVSGLNKIGLATDATVQAAENRVNNLGASVQDLEAKADGFKTKMVEAGKSALHAFDNTGRGAATAGDLIRAAASAARDLVGSNEDVAAAAEKAAEKTDALKNNQGQLSREILKTAAAIELANQKWSEDPSADNLAVIEALKAKYIELQNVMAGLSPPDLGGDKPGGVDNGLVNQFRDLTDSANKATEATGRTRSRVAVLGDELGKTGDKAKQVGTAAVESAGNVGAAIASIGAGWANYINDLSQKAGAAFKEKLGFKEAADAASELEVKLATVNARLSDMDARLTNGGSISSLLRSWAKAGFETEQAFLQQAIAVEKLTDKILQGDTSASVLRDTAEDLEHQFNLLDGSQLAPLIGAIQSAKREMDALNDSILDTIAASEQELASLRGDQEEVERLRYLERQGELQDQLNAARQLGDTETIANAERALGLANEAYGLRLQEAKERTEQERQRQLDYEQRQAQQKQDAEREERQDISRTEQRTQTQTTQLARAVSSQTVTLNLQANGSSLGSLTGLQPDQVAALLRAIESSTFLTTG